MAQQQPASMVILIAGLQFQPYFQANNGTSSSSCGPNSPDKLLSEVASLFGRLDSTEKKAKVVVSGFGHDEKVNNDLLQKLKKVTQDYGAAMANLEYMQCLEHFMISAKPLIDDVNAKNVNLVVPERDVAFSRKVTSLILNENSYDVQLTTVDYGSSLEAANEKSDSEILATIQAKLSELPPADGLPVKTLQSPMILQHNTFYHGFTTRTGGVSTYPTMKSLTLTMSPKKKDTRVYVEENRKRLAKAVGFNYENFKLAQAVHGIDVWVVGDDPPSSYDAIVTNKQGVTIAAPGADCQTLLFCDPVKIVVGAAHSGWKGTIDRIQQNVVKIMKERFDCNPDDIHVAIGPSIDVCCYNVGEDRAKDFEQSVGESVVQRKNGVAYLDLWNATVILLKEVGIKRENIDDGKRFNDAELNGQEKVTQCTQCNPGKFFSYRRDGAIFGNQVGFIGIR